MEKVQRRLSVLVLLLARLNGTLYLCDMICNPLFDRSVVILNVKHIVHKTGAFK